MMEKSAQPGEGGGCTPIPFHYIYHHVGNCDVNTLQVRGQMHSSYFSSTLICIMWKETYEKVDNPPDGQIKLVSQGINEAMCGDK